MVGKQKYKLRCRKNGILVTTDPNTNKYDIVWCRKENPIEKFKIDDDYKRR